MSDYRRVAIILPILPLVNYGLYPEFPLGHMCSESKVSQCLLNLCWLMIRWWMILPFIPWPVINRGNWKSTGTWGFNRTLTYKQVIFQRARTRMAADLNRQCGDVPAVLHHQDTVVCQFSSYLVGGVPTPLININQLG